MEISKELQLNHLHSLFKHAGWAVLENKINEQIQLIRNQLENNGAVNVSAAQEAIRAYKFVLRQVIESKGSKKDANE